MQSDVYVLPKHLRGEHLQAALLDALAAAVGALTRLGPLVVLVEDWHWADTGSRAAFARVADLAAALPLTLIVTSRAEQGAADRWPSSTTFVRLERLDFAASTAIVEAALGVRKVSGALARRLYDRAGGNPFFLEQMCAALLEQRAVTVRDGDAVVEGGENRLALPDTVQGVIRARLDNLDARALEVARVAAVIGREFDHALLAEVAPADVDLRSAIAAAEAAGLIHRTSVAPTLAYRFTHALTQEVCYDSLVGHQRKTLHGAIGRALASTHATGSTNAPHCSRTISRARKTGRRRSTSAGGRRSGRSRSASSATRWRPRSRCSSGPAACPIAVSEVVADLLLQQERVCETLGLRARQQQIIDPLIAHLAREEGSVRLAEVYLRQGDLSTLLKRFDAADRALTTALRSARSAATRRWCAARCAASGCCGGTRAGMPKRSRSRAARSPSTASAATTSLSPGPDEPRKHPESDGRLSRERGRGSRRRWRCRRFGTIPKKLVYTQHNLANVYRAIGDLDRALECLAAERRDCPRPPAADSAIVPPHLDRAHPAAAGTDRRRRSRPIGQRVDLSRRARHAEAWCSRCGCSATRCSASRATRRRCRAWRRRRSCSRSSRTACRKRRCGAASPESSSARSPDDAAEAWSVVS